MSEYALDLWQRAVKAAATADVALQHGDCDAAASRAYYAAFYAVSASFALRGQTFRKHSAVEAALHRDLLNTGAVAAPLGPAYRSLRRLRETGDYGGLEHVTPEQASQAVQAARRIIQAIGELCPELPREASPGDRSG